MKVPKKRRLIVHMSIIAVFIFIITLAYIIVSDYYITRNAYLSAKNEMIERDMQIVCDDLKSVPSLKWLLNYMKEHREDLTRELTEEETKVNKSEEFRKYSNDIILYNKTPNASDGSIYQMLQARLIYTLVSFCMTFKTQFNYSLINFMKVNENNDGYLICSVSPDTKTTANNSELKLGADYELDPSEHSAWERVLAGELDGNKNVVYETFEDPDDDKQYYIGYSSVITLDGDKYILSLLYDWSNYYEELINSALSSMILGFVILVIIDAVLIFVLYFKAISPIQRITAAILQYKEEKSGKTVEEKMKGIKVKNEIGVLAESFYELTTEISRHTNEIIRLSGEKERIETELNVATQIQADALPKTFPAFPDRPEFDIYATMTPAKEVGGDFYDFFLIDDDHFAMVMADVSGKGVPAALFMMTAKTLIKNRAQLGEYSPARILRDVNNQICEGNTAALFVTVWLAIIQLSTGKGKAANAGHEDPAVKRNGGKFELIEYKHSPPVAIMEDLTFKEHEFEMKKGDTVFMYTDGVPEATNKDDELFGTDRMIDALNIEPNASNEKLLENVKKAVEEFVGDAPQFDDLTMLGFTYYGE